MTDDSTGDRPAKSKNKDDWSYRGIGALCGGVLGIAGAALLLLLLGEIRAVAIFTVLAIGLLSGCGLGWRSPGVADVVLSVFHLFT